MIEYKTIHRMAIQGYRSIRSLVLHLGQLNVITGPNGCGKSNVYRSLRLMAEVAEGRLLRSLAKEGGLSSVLWAGPEVITAEMMSGRVPIQGSLRKKPVGLKLGFSGEPFSYCFDLGLPTPSQSMFHCDPEMKRECLWRGMTMDAKSLVVDRRKSSLRCRSAQGTWQSVDLPIAQQSSMVAEYSDPYSAPELIVLRDILRSWRFYDTFRIDANSPARRVSIGTFTPVMASDGSDFAAALQTIREIGDSEGLTQAVEHAFPGSSILVSPTEVGLRLSLQQPAMLRELSAAELSDGTLRYLLLLAALLTPRPPALLVLNEPESSLHPELIAPLAALIRAASKQSQVIVVTHSQSLADALEQDEDCVSLRLTKKMGQTILDGGNQLDQYAWQWPAR